MLWAYFTYIEHRARALKAYKIEIRKDFYPKKPLCYRFWMAKRLL